MSTRPTFDTAMDRAGPQEQQEWKLKGADDWGEIETKKTWRKNKKRNSPAKLAVSQGVFMSVQMVRITLSVSNQQHARERSESLQYRDFLYFRAYSHSQNET